MTDGGPYIPAQGGSGLGRFFRSLALRLIVLVVVFVAMPILIYQQFEAADEDKQTLLLDSAQRQGQLIAAALGPRLKSASNGIPADLSDDLALLADDGTRIRLLLLPSRASGVSGFFYVASAPQVSIGFMDAEREELMARGILDRLAMSCEGEVPLALRLGGQEDGGEIVTSITPINTVFGCWAVVTSQATDALLGTSLGQEYWQTPEIKAAALIYVAMAMLALAMFVDIWRNLRRFGRLARKIGVNDDGTVRFAAQNRLPELDSVAQDFDRLVDRLRRSAEDIRQAAEDNAHAFKTPIGVIRQSVEPLKRLIGEERRGRLSIEMIELSVHKLDTLVSGARRMDEATADLVDPTMHELDLSKLMTRMVKGATAVHSTRNIHFDAELEPNLKVRATEDMIETIVENILDNAASFSLPGGSIEIRLRKLRDKAELTIRDHGPGVAPEKLARIFERYYSDRPAMVMAVNAPLPSEETHFGIGLWIVRQNVLALGGDVAALNHADRGLVVRVALPLAR
ncbi:HAMP domain-containing sensor histidine kinase [Inquilinus sp. CAU 1745]|uniref:sensor histidine kinase n=1 Tax=Inquilinus sp. CAU 1745 TaxID=3140369 RepID=UPI00325C0914